jgi:hypothetical protein
MKEDFMKFSQSILLAGLILGTVATQAMANGALKSNDISTLALKNFREILSSLAVVTGVDPTSQDIATFYQSVQAQLPRTGTLAEFNAQSYLAASGLGSVFCSHIITADAATGTPKTGFNAGIDFTKGPKSVTSAQRNQLAQNYISAFLQRNAVVSEQSNLSSLFSAQIDSSNTPAETQNAVLAVCSSVASSIEFLSN